MIAVDTNILVYAHREDSPWHESAYAQVAALAEGRAAWAIPWPCLHEFLAIVTHPRIYDPPSSLEAATDQVDAWLQAPSLILLGEAEGYWGELRAALAASLAIGPRVHDARVAALCRLHAIEELWTLDRDFGRFPGVKVKNPLLRKSSR
ncbi:MAG: PIN domain-containing protein [Acidobacteriota bacterium]|nr:PIN domain-containing protein [Acidobacteriota bacterium]